MNLKKTTLAGAIWLLNCTPGLATTIAFDGITIAGDSQTSTATGNKFFFGTKIYFIKEKHVWVGCAGGKKEIQAFLRAFATGIVTDEMMKEVAAIVCHADGSIDAYDEQSASPCRVSAPYAIGSGADAARAAMLSGKTAAQAVAIAEQIDLFTGGKIYSANVAGTDLDKNQ